METFQKVQKKISDAKRVDRVNRSEDFPCRGIVYCVACNGPPTGCWSKWKLKKYFYYLCKSKGCVFERKSIPRSDLHDAIEKNLSTLEPSLAAKIFFERFLRAAVTSKHDNAATMHDFLKKDLASLQKQEDRILDKIVAEDDPIA